MEQIPVRQSDQTYAGLARRYGMAPPAAALWRLWRMLSCHRLLTAACTIAVVASTAYFTSRVTPQYEAFASIRIEQDDSRLAEIASSRPPLPNELPTEFQVLQSRTLLEAVADSLAIQVELRAPANVSRESLFGLCKASRDAPAARYRLKQEPGGGLIVQELTTGNILASTRQDAVLELPGVRLRLTPEAARYRTIDLDVISFEAAVEKLQEAVKVKRRSPEANILDVSYRGTDPQLVQLVPNVLAARFVMSRQSERHAQARSAAKFLSGQLAKLSGRLRDAEERVRVFEQRQGVVSLADEASTGVSRAAELQARRNAIEAERTALAELVDAVRDSIERDPVTGVLAYRNVVAFPTLLQNNAMSQLLSSLTVVEDRLSDLRSRRTAQDPDVQVLTARANQIGAQLGAIAASYLQGLANQVIALDSVLGQSRRQLDQIPAKEVELARLERESKGLEQIVTLLQSRLKEAEIAEAVEDPTVRLVDSAILPRIPVSPKPALNVALALVMGLGLGAAAAFLREYLDRTVRTRHDMQTATGVSVLGLLPHAQGARWSARRGIGRARTKRPVIVGNGDGHPRSNDLPAASAGLIRGDSALTLVEAYHLLDTNLAFAAAGTPAKVLTVTSPLPGEGKTTVAVNLAVTLARRGMRVLLLDADLRCGLIASAFYIAQEPGLSDVLLGALPFAKAVHRIHISETGWLHVMTRGKAPGSPAQLLGSPEAQSVFRAVRDEYDSVIVDTPPVNVVADASLTAVQSDGVILVARAGVTEIQALAFAMDQLAHVRASVMGAVLNDIDFRRDAAYDDAYRYYAHRNAYAHHAD